MAGPSRAATQTDCGRDKKRASLVLLAAIFVSLSSTIASNERDAGPDPESVGVALVEEWASRAPIVGLRCSAVLLGGGRLATARHCLEAGTALVVDGSLCEPADGSIVLNGALAQHGALAQPGAVVADGLEIAQVVGLDGTPATIVAPPVSGLVSVWGYGVQPRLGRPACVPYRYDGYLDACPRPLSRGEWCVDAPAETQLCGGSSGAPVLVRGARTLTVVGVVIAGPRCGVAGPVLVGTFSD